MGDAECPLLFAVMYIYFWGDLMYRRIRDLREDKYLTQKQVAEHLNCSQQVYPNYELGQRDIPTQTLIALAKLHDTSVDYLLGISDNPKHYRADKSGKA